MDPDANLREQRELARRILSVDDDATDTLAAMAAAVRLAELVLALAEWRRLGGFPPAST